MSAVASLRMSAGEIAAAQPSRPMCSAECHQLRFERNAWRDRCHALERAVAYLLGRDPDLEALDREVQASAEREAAVIAAIARLVLPASPA